MVTKYKIIHFKILYIFFVPLSLIIFFFSTANVEGKAFDINNIEISKPFEINFDKNKVIDEGFKLAFKELISVIVNSSDQIKINQTKLNLIKGMIESFSIKEEKFVNENYYMKLGVSFNKKKVFNYLEKKNIFPSVPIKKKILFIPIIIQEQKKDLLMFSNNKIYEEWNNHTKSFHLLEYILPTEDLEDLNLVKSKYEIIEQYDFSEITNKYYLKDSIIALVFKKGNQTRVLSRISINENIVLKNQSFSNININNLKQIELLIKDLKIIYEDYWKQFNQINTSIRLELNIKVDNSQNSKIQNFEKTLSETDLIYDFFITKFNKDFVYYKIIFNGTPTIFLKAMKKNNFNFNTQNKIWDLK
jgi:hypothetical protein